MHQRTLGRSKSSLPVIGMGSSNTFDVGASAAERAPLAEVLHALHEAGGRRHRHLADVRPQRERCWAT